MKGENELSDTFLIGKMNGAPQSTFLKVLQRVMGFYSWFCSLERLLFSLAGASYLFIAEAGDSWLPLWPSVKKELNQLADMLPLVRTFWAWERSPFVVAQDAEGPNSYDHGGCGVVVRSVSAQDWDWAVKSFPRIPRPLLPSEEDFISARAWAEVSAIRWFYREHINLGELEAIIEWVKQIVGRFSLPTSGSTFATTTSYYLIAIHDTRAMMYLFLSKVQCRIKGVDLRVEVKLYK